jgi:hypothetical protein
MQPLPLLLLPPPQVSDSSEYPLWASATTTSRPPTTLDIVGGVLQLRDAAGKVLWRQPPGFVPAPKAPVLVQPRLPPPKTPAMVVPRSPPPKAATSKRPPPPPPAVTSGGQALSELLQGQSLVSEGGPNRVQAAPGVGSSAAGSGADTMSLVLTAAGDVVLYGAGNTWAPRAAARAAAAACLPVPACVPACACLQMPA